MERNSKAIAQTLLPIEKNQLDDENIQSILCIIRKYLGMDAAFISNFLGDELRFEYLETEQKEFPVQKGDKVELCNTYCKKIVDKEISELTNDTHKNPITKALPATKEVNIGAYLGVPIYLTSGKVYGTLCCLKHEADISLNMGDTMLMRALADLLSETLSQKKEKIDEFNKIRRRILEAIADKDLLSIVYQPIFDLNHNKISSVEALSRFQFEPYISPDVWFSDAYKVGLGDELEFHTIQMSLAALNALDSTVSVSINSSPQFILSGNLAKALKGFDLERVIIEITEHALIDSYEQLQQKLKPLREKGLRIAVDDAGSGYASFHHIVELNADIIKLDISLVRDIDKDKKREALVTALVAYAKKINCEITTEGVEKQEEYEKIKELKADKIQGYYVSKPKSLDELNLSDPE